LSEENLEDHFVKLTGGADDEEPAQHDRGSRKGWRR
jgi:hypothetical protein